MIMTMVFKMSVIAEGVKGQLNKEKVEKLSSALEALPSINK